MKRKILIVLLGLLILSQVPFAYRRYRLRKLKNAIQLLATQRVPSTHESDFVDYKGVIHVHSFLGGHSTGNFDELISGAKANQLDFVIMTEHPQADFDTSAMTLTGRHNGVLFINGNEVSTGNGDRLLLIPGTANASSFNVRPTQEIINEQKTSGGISFAAYPSESQNWQMTTVEGVEVYNVFSNARHVNPLVTFFDGLWSYRGYADLMFANFFTRPAGDLARWDNAIAGGNRKLVAIAGNDAHANVGISLNDASGNQLLGLKLDPYERSFRLVRTHVLIPRDKALTRETLLGALSQGHCYISFDLFADANGFNFRVSNSDKLMGDDIALGSQPELIAQSPIPARFVLLRDGEMVEQKSGTIVEFTPSSVGSYRVELYLDSLPAPATGQPWIISNPVYVR